LEDFNQLLDLIERKISFANCRYEKDGYDMPNRLTGRDIRYAYDIVMAKYNDLDKTVVGGNPIYGEYFAIIHKDMEPVIRKNKCFIAKEDYVAPLNRMPNSIGCFFNIQFISLDDDRLINKDSSAMNKNLYNNIFFERDYKDIADVVNLRCTL